MHSLQKYTDKIDRTIFGGKAYWLAWLKQQGYNVPFAVFIPINYESNTTLYSDICALFEEEGFDKSFAARSSSLDEDDIQSSQAGIYKSFTQLSSLKAAVEKVPDIQKSGKSVGVIIQRYISASFAGVIFSSCPTTGSRDTVLINYIAGNSEQLLDGGEIGNEIEVSYSKYCDGERSEAFSILPSLSTLIDCAKNIEVRLGYPVDIEWCVERETNTLFLIQCRPITNLRYETTGLIEVNKKNRKLIPSEILEYEKVQLRLKTSWENMLSTKAYLFLMNIEDYQSVDILDVISNKVKANRYNLGFRQILILPERVDGQVIRMFSENSIESLAINLENMQDIGFKHNWQTAILFHELYDLQYMGIVKKLKNRYLLEVAYGGFIQKGVTESSQYITDSNSKVIRKNEKHQKLVYNIQGNEIIEEKIDKHIVFSNSQIKQVIDTFLPLLDDQLTVEFGISQSSNSFTPYLIDYIKDATSISISNVSAGVVSRGTIRGSILNLAGDGEWLKSIQTHYHNGEGAQTEDLGIESTNIIFVVDKPYVSLVEILGKYDPGKIGFIFKEASILSHLCILLREKKIPAITSSKVYHNDEQQIIRA